jgi:hypothetical protein
MERVGGRILDGDIILAADVEVMLEVITPPLGPKSWHGALVLSDPWPLEPSGLLRLELEDGRSGTILVSNTEYSTPGQTTVLFEGTGALE